MLAYFVNRNAPWLYQLQQGQGPQQRKGLLTTPSLCRIEALLVYSGILEGSGGIYIDVPISRARDSMRSLTSSHDNHGDDMQLTRTLISS